MNLSLILLFVTLLSQACTTSPIKRGEVQRLSSSKVCGQILDNADWDREETLLGTTQDLYQSFCYHESLKLGEMLRSRLRDKEYSVTSEVLSVLGPEQMTQTYVMESHERVYLTILLAMNSMQLKNVEAAKVELRRASQDLDAVLYNHGRDDVSHLLLAGLWEDLGESEMAAPYWKRIGLENLAAPAGLANPWHIYAVGEMQGYDWGLGGRGSIYNITSKVKLPEKCVSGTGALIPISDWVGKMQIRHTDDYHPLLNLKSYIRFPIGVGYGLLLGTSGVGVAVLGCAADANGNGNGISNGELCGNSIKAGAMLAGQAPNAFNYAAQPDLRHWPKSPVAFLVTRSPDPSLETCASSLPRTRLHQGRSLSGDPTRAVLDDKPVDRRQEP